MAIRTVPCDDLEAALAHYQGEFGFRLDMLLPADDPTEALLSRGEERVRLLRNGSTGIVAADCGFQIHRADDVSWVQGRAGMEYCDLLPGRLGGDLIASRIRIRRGGPVPDYVHYHKIRFQLIVCIAGWVRVAYEDQGDPILLERGDACLQPPEIRHRVLEASEGLEVLELCAPAVHETWVEHELELPSGPGDPERRFGGQLFRHFRLGDGDVVAFGLERATDGLAEATWNRRVVAGSSCGGDRRAHVLYCARGTPTLRRAAESSEQLLRPGDTLFLPAGESIQWTRDTACMLFCCAIDLAPRS